MALEDLRRYLPVEDNSIANAFEQVLKRQIEFSEDEVHNPNNLRLIGQCLEDMVRVAIAYLASHQADGVISEIGEITWFSATQQRLWQECVPDVKQALIDRGMYKDDLVLTKGRPVTIINYGMDAGTNKTATVLLPTSFYLKVREAPVEALAAMVFTGSQVRDMENGRMIYDPQNIRLRASAAEAHFLRGVVAQHPDVLLTHHLQELLQSFPKGIQSLPPGVWYQGLNYQQLSGARNN